MWNYRIVKYADGDGYGLHEVYYDDDGVEEFMSVNPAEFLGDAPKKVVEQLMIARTDARKRPVFNEPKEWADGDTIKRVKR